MINTYITAYVLVNIVTAVLFAVDKYKAKFGGRRISEKTLILFSFLFGALGGIFGMVLFNHKTRKPKFFVLLPLLLIIQIILLSFILF